MLLNKTSPRRVDQLMVRFGFTLERVGTKHFIYRAADGVTVSVPMSPRVNVWLSEVQVRRIIARRRHERRQHLGG